MFRSFRTILVTAAAVAAIGGLRASIVPSAAAYGAARPAPSPDSSAARSARAGREAIATRWAASWNHADGDAMSALFTKDGVYTDRAFQGTFTGESQIAEWVQRSTQGIDSLKVDVESVFGDDGSIAVVSTFSGQLRGAPQPFAVPVATIFTLDGDRVRTVTDTYNLAPLLQQSGLPADFQPGQPTPAA